MSLEEPALQPPVNPDEDVENRPASPLLLETPPEIQTTGMTRGQAYNLYTSHFLSTWNVRTYEFAAVSVESDEK
jgi:iron-regulated transporter 1